MVNSIAIGVNSISLGGNELSNRGNRSVNGMDAAVFYHNNNLS